jgi:hypothetical protein
MSRVKFLYPVYNPCVNVVDVAADWGDFTTTQCRSTALKSPFSIAAMRVFYDEPWIFSFEPEVAQIDVSDFDLVLLSDIEYYSQREIQEWAHRKGIKNYLLAVGGLNQESLASNVVYRPYWVNVYLNKNSPGHLNTTTRTYMFDCMLGARRPHRDYVMLALTHTGLLDQCIVTYRDCFPGAIINEYSESFAKLFPNTKLNWPYVSPNLDTTWEVGDQITNRVSFDSPLKIFKNSNYSIVTETIGTGDNFFLSEKTIKAMHAYRPFVVFGPRHYLRNLNKMGFQTFSTVIDESYDDEPVDSVRFQKAMLQVLRLAYFESVDVVYNGVTFALENNALHLGRIGIETQEIMDRLLMQTIGHRYCYSI